MWLINKTLSGTTTQGQSGPGSKGNEEVLHIPQSPSITGVSPSDCLVSCPGHLLGRSHPSAEMQLVYSTAPVDWTGIQLGLNHIGVRAWHHRLIRAGLSNQSSSPSKDWSGVLQYTRPLWHLVHGSLSHQDPVFNRCPHWEEVLLFYRSAVSIFCNPSQRGRKFKTSFSSEWKWGGRRI